MKILFIPSVGGLKVASDYKSEYQMGAIEQQVFGIAKELSSKSHEVFIMRPWADSKEIETLSGVKLVNVNMPAFQRGFYESLAFIRMPMVLIEHLIFLIKAYKTTKTLNPDIIHISSILTGYFAYFLNMGHSKKVFTTHDHDVYLGKGIVSLLKRKMIQSTIKKSDKVVTLNDGMKDYMCERGFRVDAVIPNAISLDNYENRGNCGFILFAGRLVPHKKVEDLIKVYSEICGDYKEDLVIIGSGPCERNLKNYAQCLGVRDRIHFISFLPRPKYRHYLSECSIFVFPSEAEAFGVVIIEAMGCGKPVIARNIIGPKDIIKNGQNGFLFNDSNELKKILALLISDGELRKRIGTDAKQTVKQKYTFAKIAESYEELYQGLLIQRHSTENSTC